MYFFKRNFSGYTLLEIMLTISISAYILTFCYRIQQQSKKKHLRNYEFEARQECLDFFSQASTFFCISTHFKQETPQSFTLTLIPDTENALPRHLEVKLNGSLRNKNTLNLITHHIQELSLHYYDASKKTWKAFKYGTHYSNLDFIKVILWNKQKEPLDVFIFSSYTSQP